MCKKYGYNKSKVKNKMLIYIVSDMLIDQINFLRFSRLYIRK